MVSDHPCDGEGREGAGGEVVSGGEAARLIVGVMTSLGVCVVLRSHGWVQLLPRLIRPSSAWQAPRTGASRIPAQHAGRGGAVPVLGQALQGEALTNGKHTTRVPGQLVVPALGPWGNANAEP